MARDTVVFKGTRGGISIQIDEEVEFKQALADLRKKLKLARNFFAGAAVQLQTGGRQLSEDQRRAVADLVGEYGLTLAEEEEIETDDTSIDDEQTLMVRRTLRSGQRIVYSGHLVILGDVNPGAEIVATGDIVVLGTLRGVAHAGAAGDDKAVIIGLQLEPTQVRIANYISRSPDGQMAARPPGPELAYVQEGHIVIKGYEPGQGPGVVGRRR
ncbi:MAG: septum site-determining protein MinC [Limnochordia bacterium]